MKIRNILYIILFLIGCTKHDPEFKIQAVGASTVFQIDSAGHANGACLFDSSVASPGTDRSQDAAYHKSGTDLASTNGTTNPCIVTSASAPFTSADNGNGLIVTAGSNWTVQRALIVSVDGSGNATLDRACGSAATLSNGTWGLGRACALGNSTSGISDDALFEMAVAGNKFYIKNGTYSPTTIALSANGAAQKPIIIEGFNSVRGDLPTGSTRPILDFSTANSFTSGQFWVLKNLQVTGSAANVLITGGNTQLFFIKATNTSTTASRNAINTSSSTDVLNYGIEAVSYRGAGIFVNGGSADIYNGYFHDSNIGISLANTTAPAHIQGNIFAGNITNAIAFTGAQTAATFITNNTIVGWPTPRGTLISILTGGTDFRIFNNIIYGGAVGVAHPDTQTIGFDNWNAYNNNTADVSGGWTKGANTVTTAPGFARVLQMSGTGATSSASTLTDATVNFTTTGIVAGQDFLYVSAMTGGNGAGIYPITAVGTTTLTTGLALGSGTAISYQILYGRNFAIGPNYKNRANPGVFPGALTTSYQDIGAVQRKEGFPRGR